MKAAKTAETITQFKEKKSEKMARPILTKILIVDIMF